MGIGLVKSGRAAVAFLTVALAAGPFTPVTQAQEGGPKVLRMA